MSFVNTTSQGNLKIAGGDVIAFYKTLSGWPKYTARNQSERSLQMDMKNKMAASFVGIAVRLDSSFMPELWNLLGNPSFRCIYRVPNTLLANFWHSLIWTSEPIWVLARLASMRPIKFNQRASDSERVDCGHIFVAC